MGCPHSHDVKLSGGLTFKEEERPDVFIHLRINSRITTCLLDTGSPISLGNSSNFKKVNDSNAILKSVGGKRIIAKGEIDVEIENNAGEIINQKLIIVDNLGIDVVLGRDYINRIEQGKVLINIIQKMDIKNNVEENIFMVNVNAEIKKDEEEFNLDMVKRLQKEDEMIKTINDILYIVKEKNNIIMIPKKAIIPLLMYVHENKVNGCHMGINRTYEEIKTRCYWINMIKDITKWIRSCEVCQLYKQSREKRKIDTLNIQIEGVP